jgi:surfeit locus 1 family protein
LRDWPVVNAGVEKHHGYAAQWFALTALIVGLFAWFQLRRRTSLPKDPDFHV